MLLPPVLRSAAVLSARGRQALWLVPPSYGPARMPWICGNCRDALWPLNRGWRLSVETRPRRASRSVSDQEIQTEQAHQPVSDDVSSDIRPDDQADPDHRDECACHATPSRMQTPHAAAVPSMCGGVDGDRPPTVISNENAPSRRDGDAKSDRITAQVGAVAKNSARGNHRDEAWNSPAHEKDQAGGRGQLWVATESSFAVAAFLELQLAFDVTVLVAGDQRRLNAGSCRSHAPDRPRETAIPTDMSTVVAVAGRPRVTTGILGPSRSEGVSGPPPAPADTNLDR
jgi:hypothetical protein